MTIQSIPPSDVFVDGTHIVMGSVFRKSFPAGQHHVRLVTPDGRSKEFDVTIKPDSEVTKRWNFATGEWL